MQETEFISQNKEKWKEFEDVLRSSNKDPNRLTNLFIETTDDLSYSRTFYPNRSVRVYLNGISQQVFQAIYRNRTGKKNRFTTFWKRELPEALWYHRNALLQAFVIFLFGLAIGIVSSIYYPDFAKIILGDSYVEMTQANIDSGDPMAVYKDGDALDMYFKIALNNIRVSFLTFVLGIFFAIGTYYIVFYNAIMVGAFIYFFIERDLFRESFLTIMLHGTLELSMIVISGCAGLALARGLLFPGTYTRMQALMQSARNGIKIMIAVTVFLLYAAFIESFVTRITDMPGIENGKLIVDVVRSLLILLSAGVVVGYFVLYPRYLYRKGWIGEEKIHEIPFRKEAAINDFSIKKPGKIFTDSFYFFAKNARRTAALSLVMGAVVTLYFGFSNSWNYNHIFELDSYYSGFNFFWVWSYFNYHLDFERYPLFFPVLVVLFSVWMFVVRSWFLRGVNKNENPSKPNVFKALLPSAFVLLPLLFSHILTVLIFPFVFPLGILWYCVSTENDGSLFSAFGRTFTLLKKNFWSMVGTFFLVLSIQWLSFYVLNTALLNIFFEFIQMNIPHTVGFANQIGSCLYTLLLFAVPAYMFTLTVYAMGLFYYSIKEINTADHLVVSIDGIGSKRRAYGLEQEH